jgi:hypothetical protein
MKQRNPPRVSPILEKRVHEIKLPFSILLSFSRCEMISAGKRDKVIVEMFITGSRAMIVLVKSRDQKEFNIMIGVK